MEQRSIQVSIANVNVHRNGFEIVDRGVVFIQKCSRNGVHHLQMEVYPRDRISDETCNPRLTVPLTNIQGIKYNLVVDEGNRMYEKGQLIFRLRDGSPCITITTGWASASYLLQQFRQA